jgi:hypothetical protein
MQIKYYSDNLNDITFEKMNLEKDNPRIKMLHDELCYNAKKVFI